MASKANTTQNRKRVFSYARWSSEPQSAGYSERRQIQQALDWCQQNGRVLDERRFTDRGVSGWKGAHSKSGNLAALLNLVQAGDVILVEDASRWSRERSLVALNALESVVNKDVEIVFLRGGLVVNRENFNSPDVFLSNVLNSFMANRENEDRAEKIRQAMKTRRATVESGRAVQGRLPAWLAWDKATDKPVVVEAKAAVVRQIFSWCNAGLGVRAILHRLRGQPPISNSSRAHWNSRFVHRLLTDKSVIGYHGPTGVQGKPVGKKVGIGHAANASP